MLQVFRIEYILLRTKEPWKATIVSYSRKEAERLITKLVRSPINITGFEVLAKLDGIADDVIEKIVEKYRPIVEEEIRAKLEVEQATVSTQKQAPAKKKAAPAKKSQEAAGKRSIRRKK